jgi:hypothetical protein
MFQFRLTRSCEGCKAKYYGDLNLCGPQSVDFENAQKLRDQALGVTGFSQHQSPQGVFLY